MFLNEHRAANRLAQPPGGASHMSSLMRDNARLPGRQPAPRLAGQAPGGRSSFAFDDYAGQADEYLGKAVPRRNGVKQIGAGALPSQVNFNDGSSTPLDAVQPRVPVKEYVQPPGGRASFAFDDYSPPPQVRDPRAQPPGGRSSVALGNGSSGDDALNGFMAQQQQQHQAPPPQQQRPQLRGLEKGQAGGGYSQFSVGWGNDNYCNQHHHARVGGRPPQPSYRQPPPQELAAAPYAMPAGVRSPTPVRNRGGGGGFGGGDGGGFDGGAFGGGGGGGGGARVSGGYRVSAPPGGASSICFG